MHCLNERNMRLGVIVAMGKELEQLLGVVEKYSVEQHGNHTFYIGSAGRNEVVLHQCGIGKVNAAVGAMELISHYRPDNIVSTGVAGGASLFLEPGDVIVGKDCCYHDVYCGPEGEYGQVQGLPARYPASSLLLEHSRQLEVAGNLYEGLIVSGDWFVDSREKMGSILDHFPEAVGVDMESAALAQVCHIYGVGFLSIRTVSDVPLKDTHAAQYMEFWERVAEGSFQMTRTFIETL